MKILFVDDEKLVLEGIKRILFEFDWQILTAESGREALEIIKCEAENGHIDVVVSDMRMPHMNGAELLGEVSRLYPGIVRMVLSGHADQKTALKASLVAHQWLDKPCTQQDIVNALCTVDKGFIQRPSMAVKKAVGQVRMLPSPPEMFVKINTLMKEDHTNIDKVAIVISEDPSISAKVLQFTNSSFFPSIGEVIDIKEAVVRLGSEIISGIVLLAESYSEVPDNKLFCSIEEQQRCLVISRLVRKIAPDNIKSEAAIAGLLHDIGKYILVLAFPDKVDRFILQAEGHDLNNCVNIEQSVFSTDHAELGAYLLFLWGFPAKIIEGLMFHHDLESYQNEELNIASVIYIANCLFDGREIPTLLLDNYNLSSEIDEWQRYTSKLLS